MVWSSDDAGRQCVLEVGLGSADEAGLSLSVVMCGIGSCAVAMYRLVLELLNPLLVRQL